MDHPHVNPARPELVEEFFRFHLPAKLSALESYPRHSEALSRSNTEPIAQGRISSAMSFASMVSGRMLLEFLGVTYDVESKGLRNRRRNPKNKKAKYDVYVNDLGGVLVDVTTDLLQGEAEELRPFLHAANRSTHLTWDDRKHDGWQNINGAVAIILRLLDKHLYTVTGRTRPHKRP